MARKERLNLPHVGIASFARFPICEDLDKLDADIAILGFPFDEGSNFRSGSRMGPRKIRDMSLRFSYPRGRKTGYFDIETGRDILTEQIKGNRIWDCGDVDIVYTKPMETQHLITEMLTKVLAKGAFPVTYGGDHSISFPVLRAYKTDPIDIVMIDGHLDFTDHAGGILYQEMLDIMKAVTKRAPVIGFDITEVNPNLDLADLTSCLSALLTIRFLGMATQAPYWKTRPWK
jgi:agmatinase